MKLTKAALKKVNTQLVRLAIAQAVPCSETWVRELIKNNKDNGPLTTYAVLQVIRKETGLTDAEILEVGTKKIAA